MTDSNGNGATAQLQVWRTIAVALMTFILGFGVPYVVNQRAATKDDLASALIPIQKQLDDHSAQLGEIKEASKQTDIDLARVATKLNITARPTP